MKVAVYFSPWSRTVCPTGVGRHAVEMTQALGCRTDVDLYVFTTRQDRSHAIRVLSERNIASKTCLLPGTDWGSRLLFVGLHCVGVDRWSGQVDWVYCPKEQPVATAKARLAVNVHDVLTFEPQIEGLPKKPSLRSSMSWALTRRHLKQADLITTVSEFTRQRLVELLQVNPERIAVTGNGVSDVYFRQQQQDDEIVLKRYNVRPQEYFFATGSLTHRKGGDVLLDVEQSLTQLGYSTPILLSGRRHDADLLARHKASGQSDRYRLLRLVQYVPDEDQAVLMGHALGLVFPSRYEGFGIPALEAMAAGTVVVCSRIPALMEVAGDAGLYVEPNSAAQLMQMMISLIQGDVDRQRLVSFGRRRASEYRWRPCADRLIAAMRDQSLPEIHASAPPISLRS